MLLPQDPSNDHSTVRAQAGTILLSEFTQGRGEEPSPGTVPSLLLAPALDLGQQAGYRNFG